MSLYWKQAEKWMHFTYVCSKCSTVWTIPDKMHPNAGRCPFDYTFCYSIASTFCSNSMEEEE
jgi:hypothetical protein